jgi:tetratricopeptide (TPR) repeat protein
MKQILPHRLCRTSTVQTVSVFVILLLTGFGLSAQKTVCSEAGGRGQPSIPCSDLLIVPVGPSAPQDSPAASQTVTVQQLRHVVPKNAQKEIEKAKQAFAKHRADETIDHLKNVIRFDPECAPARNDLAVVYLRTNNPDPAIDQLEEAIKIDPRNPLFFTNLAVGYLVVHRLDAAERAARMAADLDRTGPYSLYLLGTILVHEHKFTDEALRCFERTDRAYWLGHLFAARVLIAQDNLNLAQSEIQTYLSDKSRQDPDPVYARIITNWLAYIDRGERNRSAALLQ